MDFAIAAGMHAGREVARALSAGDTSAQGLQGYAAALENCFVMQDLRQFSKVPSFMEGFHRMFDGYPQAIRDIMNTMFCLLYTSTPLQPHRAPPSEEESLFAATSWRSANQAW